VPRRQGDIGPNERGAAILTVGIGKGRKLSQLGHIAIDNVRLVGVNNGIIVSDIATLCATLVAHGTKQGTITKVGRHLGTDRASAGESRRCHERRRSSSTPR
jgi:hypothetical protein